MLLSTYACIDDLLLYLGVLKEVWVWSELVLGSTYVCICASSSIALEDLYKYAPLLSSC